MNKAVKITDQIGQTLEFFKTPKRIVSLVPSITYTLYKLGLNEQVVGITRFCKWPEGWKKQKRVVGGTKDFKLDRIAALKPDLILANKEENPKDLVFALQDIAPVYVSDVVDLKTNAAFINDMGIIFDKQQITDKLVGHMTDQANQLKKQLAGQSYKTAYLIWKNPWMSVGGDTFINQMMQYAGFENVFKDQNRYPAFEIEALKALQPEIILLSSEPYPFKQAEKMTLQEMFPGTCILLVQGEPFTWFGAYPAEAFAYFINLHKQLKPCIQKKKN